jgi:hypothetical protein
VLPLRLRRHEQGHSIEKAEDYSDSDPRDGTVVLVMRVNVSGESKADFERFGQWIAASMPHDAAPPPIEIVEEFEVYSRQTKDQLIA